MATLFIFLSLAAHSLWCEIPFGYYILCGCYVCVCAVITSCEMIAPGKSSEHNMSVTFTFAAPGERESLMIGSGPVISGPVLQDSQTGSLRRNRPNRSVLASAFQNAWKQGTMAAEVGGWCEWGGREGRKREVGIDGWEGGRVWPLFLNYDLAQRRPVGKRTKCEIASILSFSRWTKIQRNGQCLTRPPANKSPDPMRAWPTRILYHMWRKKCQGCSHWKERRTKRETERIP